MRRLGLLAPLAALAAALAATSVASAAAPVQPYRFNDGGGFHDVLPPGANGRANGLDLATFLSTGRRPAHNDDQLRMYSDLVRATPGLGAADLPTYFKDSSFGVRPEDVESTISPRDDVTIVRDKGFGVPHVYGSTRAGAMFGLGYAAAQDRLFFIDVLRHAGRGQLSSFAGGAPGNRAMDAEQWSLAPYTEADLQRQVDQGDDLYGAEGRQLQDDVASYVAGINRYIAEARLDPTKMPGEYAAIGRPQGPEDWKATDVVATASLVGGIFGKGGGRELLEVPLLRAFRARFGARLGRRLWRQFAAFDDRDAPTTVRGRRFPYQAPPAHPAKGGEVLYDRGSFRPAGTVVSDSAGGSQPPGGGLLPGVPAGPELPGLPASPVAGVAGLSALPKAMSNALVVSARRSQSGHPLAVFGPQVAYFAPQILMEQDVHAPGLDARGAAFPGVNLYVQLGRGRDYAWSATSAGQDIIDTFAVPLCDATHYRFRGRCRAIEVLERTNSWTPNLADQTAAGTQTLRAERTALGLVAGRGKVAGKPVLFTVLRSTYMHEVDSARGFARLNQPGAITGPASFMRAASEIGYTFNWFYVDRHHTAYFNSGENPVRARGTTGQLPMSSRLEWRGFDPVRQRSRYLAPARHPQIVDQDWITSWNNRQAPGYAGADTNLFSSVYRSQMLDRQVRARLRGGRKLTLPRLVDAMEEAGTTDLRGMIPLPLALRVLGTPRDGALRAAVTTLRAWARGGAHRVDRNGDGRYDDAEAVRIMDAWWPRLVRAMFAPRMGKRLLDRLEATYEVDNAPNNHGAHLGSAYQEGFYGYVAKDLRRVLGVRQRAPYAVGFCGKGRRAACRRALQRSLREAIAVPASKLYSGDEQCKKAGRDGDQMCFDSVSFRALGGVTQPLIPWINRPTYQQVVEVQAQAGRAGR
jgi:acyl-homoserine lactone acylase PvdQ